MATDIGCIRNIGVIAHIDAGKTTVTERMLFLSGASHRVGFVDSGTTVTDDDPEEQQRGITIYAACVKMPWNKVAINLLDTPGHVDFTAEVERCLRVLDGAVVVFSAREGVEAQSETVWRQADRYRVPRVAFINKMDREGADFEAVLRQMRERLGATPIPIQIPVGSGPSHVANPFRAVIDLVAMEMLTFEQQADGRNVDRRPIPDEWLPDAQIWREQMIEQLYNFSNEMMELALQEEPIPASLVHKVLRQSTIAGQVQPVLVGSALHGMGVQPLLDAVEAYLPSPLDRPAVVGFDPRKPDNRVLRAPDPNGPMCALVFKVLPAKTGDVCWVRVYSGTLHGNSRMANPGREKKENVTQLWQIHATKRERDGQVSEVPAGDIVGVVGLRNSYTGDTLCEPKEPIQLESIDFPETVISMAIELENATQRDKLAEVLEMLKKQDPTFRVRMGETGQTLISGMGELHLEIIKNRLLRDFKLNVKFHKPEVSYRETVAEAVEVQGECHRQIGGQQLFARVRLRVEPREDGGVIVLTRATPEMPQTFVQAAVETLRAAGEGGGLISGFPLMKLQVTLLEVQDDEHSDEVAFRIAANDAFDRALREAGPVLLEPIMRLTITTPDEYLGEFVGDLQQRRGIISKTEYRGTTTVIEAAAPLKELFGYSSAMRSLSQGRASFSMQPWRYEPAPKADVQRFQA